MGAKTALLAFCDGDLPAALRGAQASDPGAAFAVVREIHSSYEVTAADDSTLFETYPPEDITYATVLPGAEVLCDRRLTFERPSSLPASLLERGAGRRIVLHGMHSTVDALSFAVWEDGVLVRSLSLSPGSGIIENLGDPYDFERPYWNGDHPVTPTPGWSDQPYPLPFHPLELGEDALRFLFGFIIEGLPAPDDIDADRVHLHGFRVADPTGAEQAARRAALEEFVRHTGPPRRYTFNPDGTMTEIQPDA